MKSKNNKEICRSVCLFADFKRAIGERRYTGG